MTNEIENLGPVEESAHWERLARYLSDEASPEEAEATRDWLAANPGEAASLEALTSAVERIASVGSRTIDVDAALRRSVELRRPGMLSFRRRHAGRVVTVAAGLRIAAVLAIAVSGALLWRARGADEGGVVATQLFRASPGAPDTVRLTDGSIVILAPHSSLTVAAGFGTTHRNADLVGLGYFDLVTHAGSPPFVVRAGATVIRDIGTAFTVRTDGPDGVRVAVHQGVVIVREVGVTTEGIVLKAGDHATVGQRPDITRGGVSNEELQWTAGRLVFRDAPVAEMVREIQRWYGIRLEVSESLAGRRVNTDLTGNTVPQVIRTLELALNALASTRGDTVTLEVREAVPR